MAEIGQSSRRAPVSDCLSAVGDILPAFIPAPPAVSRQYWDGIGDTWRARLVTEGESARSGNWPVLTASAFRAFTLTGVRVDYEDAYFSRRQRLNGLALAEAVEGKGRFLDALIDGLQLVCEESGWQLPAHNSYVRGGPRYPLADPARPVIDLFAAETGAQLAVIAALHRDALEQVSPSIVGRIDAEIDARITRPYLDQHFWWMGNGDEPMNNWTAWCTQNVLLSTFVRPHDQGIRRAVLTKAAHSLDAFLKDYGDDGACDEGALYYRHAALCMFGALTVMDAVAPGAFAPLWREPKIRNMAEFILYAHVDGDRYINFADASAVLEPCGAREFLFGKAVGSDALCALAASDAVRDPALERPEEVNLYYRLLDLSTAPEMAAFDGRVVDPGSIYYPSCGLFIARDDRFVVAAKAGDNDDGHNHNDVGSVTVYKDGLPLLIDVGVETYTAKTFSADRYDIWTMQSGFHNLPSFAGVQQLAGAGYGARDVEVTLEGPALQIRMDIAGAYPPEAGVRRYERTICLTRRTGAKIVDRYMGTQPAVLSLMLCERPDLSPGRIRIGIHTEIEVVGGGQIRVEEIAITDPRLRRAWPDRIYRVLVPFAGQELRLTIPAGEATR